MTPVLETFISRFVHRFVARYYRQITLLSLVMTGLAIWVMVTQWNINSDFRALLPETSEAAQAMEEVGERVGSGSALFVVVSSPDMEANKRFADQFADRLRDLDSVSLAHFHNEKDFFEKHQLLYLQQEDLQTIRERLRDKIRDKKKKANPLFASLDDDEDEEDSPFIETADIRAKYDHLAQRDYKEYLIADDYHSLTMVVRFNESSTDLAATNRLIDKIKGIGQSLDPSSFEKGMAIEYGGGLINRQKDYKSIVGDLKVSAIFTILGLLLVIGGYFRRKRATALVMIPLVMGVCWTLAVSFLLFGELTTVSAFIFAILLGLGIDYSIHLLSGYDHARFEGKDPEAALVHCYKSVGSATVIGAMTTLATFLVLSFAQFRGLSQFGKVAALGVVYTLLAMIIVLPAMVLTFHHYYPREAPKIGGHDSVQPVFNKEQLSRFVPAALAACVLFTGMAVTQYSDISFEENFRQLGQISWPWQRYSGSAEMETAAEEAALDAERLADHLADRSQAVRKAMDPGSFRYEKRFTTPKAKYESALAGQQSSTPTVLLFDDPGEAARVYEYMQTQLQAGKLDTIDSVASIHAFVPGTIDQQEARLAEIVKIQQMLDKEDLSVLDEKATERLNEFREQLKVEKPVTSRDLPLWAKKLFKEAGPSPHEPVADDAPFAYQYLVYVNEGIDQMKGEKARRFLQQIKDVRQETDGDFRIGSQSFIYVQMLDEIKEDGLKMISIALVLVLVLLSVAFRSPIRGLVALTPLIFGGIWMFGLLPFIGIELDFFNVVILPVVIGIGVDAGVHVYRRYLERGEGSTGEVMRLVGSAVIMASMTSIVGFGGLAITEHGGLSSIGHVAIVGISSTLVGTLLMMPVIFWTAERYELDWLLPRESDKT